MKPCFLSILLCGVAVLPMRGPDPIRQVDHVVIGTAEPRALFSLLADTLRLPVAWPLASFGPYQSGGVSVGNLNIEVGRARARGVDSAQLARFNAVVFEPVPLSEALIELEARGIAHDKPLGRLLADSLRARGGGPLGVIGARTVIVGTGGDSSVQSAWRRLLSPTERRTTWSLGSGPALELDSAAPRGHVRIVLHVRSLARAAEFLRAHSLLGESSRRELQVARDRIGGLDVQLVDGPVPP